MRNFNPSQFIRRVLAIAALTAGGLGAGWTLAPTPAEASFHCENNGCSGLNCEYMENLNCTKGQSGDCTSSGCSAT